jgi:hypothetical protein
MSTMATLGNSVALVISASPEHYIPLPYAWDAGPLDL